MKRKILAIILVSIMLLSAIPAFTVSANPAVSETMDYRYYRTVVTSDTIIMDGELDEVYKNSQKISGSASTVSFEAHTAVTLRGIYIWSEIKDSTLDKTEDISVSLADRFQIYIKMYDGIDLSWGWYETDYNGKLAKHSIMDSNDIESNYETYWSCVYSTTELCDAESKTVKLPDGSGWRSEMFIPFAVELVNFTNYELSIGLQVQNDVYGNSNYSVCYDRSAVQNAWYRYDVYKPLALVKEIDRSSSYAPNYVFNMSDILTNDDVPLQGELVNNAVYVQGQSFSLDGVKDDLYSEHAKVPMVVWHTYHQTNTATATPIAPPIATMGDVYVAFDDNYIYVYYERNDVPGSHADSFDMYYLFNDGANITTSGSYFVKFASGSGSGGSIGAPGSTTTVSHKVKNLGNNRYAIECQIAIPTNVKNKLKGNNASVEMKLCFVSNEYTSGAFPTGRYYLAGSTRDMSNYYSYAEMQSAGAQYPVMRLSKTFTDEKAGEIKGASLTLGSDITLNYYAVIGSADVNNAYIKFTRAGDEYYAYPRTSDESGIYKFSYKGIAPQALGDTIMAELYVDGKVVDTHYYSALENCEELLKEYSSNVKMSNLIKSLLSYGAAAQSYVGYKTDALVNAGYEVLLNSPDQDDSVRYIDTSTSGGIEIKAVGVYFDNTNRIYVKFTTTSTLDKISVSMNGVKASVKKLGSEYIAYSDAIPVTQFWVAHNISITNGSTTRTATYSVNSYAYAKLESTDSAMVKLAKATYTYGECAKKYAGIGDTAYTVMTYNDADDNSPYNNSTWGSNKYQFAKNVMTIINDCGADIVGLQEIQQSHVQNYYLQTNLKNQGDGCYSGEIGNYAGVFYWSTPAEPSKGADDYDRKYAAYLGEMGKPSGDMVLYRKDKFEIVKDNNGNEVKGRFWLTHTPDKASILPDTEYTQCVMYLLLRDKQTGNEFLFINLHASYLEANREQIEILMDLFEAGGAKNSYLQKHAGLDMTSYRKIYTADWNCTKFTAGYNVMNANGYSATEELLGNVYKPTTTVNGGHIDFCFVKSSEFKTLKYKVINDHSLSLTTSDHYPVFSKIAWVEEYEDEPLETDWSGASAVFVGDSITRASGISDPYHKLVEAELGLKNKTHMGVAGSCFSTTSDYGTKHSPLINRYQDIPDADLIVIFMGTNDFGHDTPLGTIKDSTDVSFYGALNVIISGVKKAHPDSQIVVMTPMRRAVNSNRPAWDQENKVGCTLSDYVDAIKTVCDRNGVSVIDLFTLVTCDPANTEYFSDGLHPTALGHEMLSEVVAEELRKIPRK